MKRWQDTELWQPRFLMCGETLDTGSWFYCVTCSTTFRSRKRRYNTLYRPLTVHEVASAVGLAPSTIMKAIKRGELPHVREGKSVLVPRRAAKEFIKRRYPKLAARSRNAT